ncbi:MAG TPA: nitrate/nitrite transporter NrtS [Anaerolineaceae bacterium]|jgi:hypothetical protein
MQEWLKLCTTRSVRRRAFTTALIVGTILIAINYGETIAQGRIGQPQIFRMALTVLVPYCVSTYSSVSAIRNLKAGRS